ncbi:MAG: DUF1080 domain-containing protein, partial [Gemmatimonadetes bacterium]|nr:DUF1080 domain-containing protein [Gemmatimonadota bacterium]
MNAIHTIHTDGSPTLRPTAFRRSRRSPAMAFARAFVALAVVALASACYGDNGARSGDSADAADPPPNTLTEAERDAGWRLLFDGETTDGWRGYNREAFPDTGWAVVDGMLVVGATAGDPDVAIGGDIVTTESFSDFDLKFDFMLSEVANSGVLYRVIEA